MKIVINNCYGGFSLSSEAKLELYRRQCKYIAIPTETYYSAVDHISNKERDLKIWREYRSTGNSQDTYLTVFSPDEKYVLVDYNLERNNPELVSVVEELGPRASGPYAQLKVIEIPDNVDWIIRDHDGAEWVAEKHRTWGGAWGYDSK
jgi:hypothetical protein